MTATDLARAALLDHVFSIPYAPPATLYTGLSTTDPAVVGATEPTANAGYARVAVTAATFSGATLGDPSTKTNSSLIIYPTATLFWNTLTHALLYDAATLGNLLWFMQDLTPLLVANPDTPRHPISGFTLSLGGATNVLNQLLLNHLFTDPAWTPPATFEVGLSSTTPNSGGTGITEPTAPSYARAVLTRSEMRPAATATSGTFVTNNTTIEFPVAAESWGAAHTHWVMYNTVGGAPLMFAALPTPVTTPAGFKRRFTPGQFRATFTTIV